MLISIEPLGTTVFLPAILLGWELDYGSSQKLERCDNVPPWFLHIMQQAGGYCMSYPECAGMLLRFEGNRHQFIGEADYLIRGFRLMAEDPNLTALRREYPILRELVYTNGTEYKESALQALDLFFVNFLHLPKLKKGIEAFLNFSECDLVTFFDGWNGLECHIKSEHVGSVYQLNEELVYYIEESNRDDVIRTDNLKVTDKTLETLIEFGRGLGLSGPAQAFLLWENSD